MSAPAQDRSITIVWKGKPITWRPRDPIPPPLTAEALAALLAPLQPVPPLKRDTTEKKKFKFKDKARRGLRRLLPRMTKRKVPTKVLVTGVDTFSTSKHSFLSRLKFWKPGHGRSAESACEGCRFRKTRLGPDASSRSHAEVESRTNPLRMHSIDQERVSYDSADIMIAPSITSIPRSSPIAIPGKSKACRGRGCCSRGKNQQDGNVGAVKDTSSLDAYSVSGDSIVNITIQNRPPLSGPRYTKTENSFPGDGQVSNLNRESLQINTETVKHGVESDERSVTESLGRTWSSLSSIDGHSAPSHSFHIEEPYSHLGSDFVDVEEYLIDPSGSFPLPQYPALDSSAATEDFGFRPTCENMPGSWPGDGPPAPRKCGEYSTTAIRLLTPELGEVQGFIMSKEEVMKELKQELPPQTDTSLSYWRCGQF